MLLENKNHTDTHATSRYYLVVVQYAAQFNAMGLRSVLAERTGLPKSKFNFRVASAESCCELTGFENGSVTPFGMLTKVPVILSEACTLLDVIWMGGGHPQLKIGCAVNDFVQRFDPLVLDVSDPRPSPDSPLKEDSKSQKNPEKKKNPAESFRDYGSEEDTAASRLALVVGRVLRVWPHPDSEKLWCEDIDCGEGDKRTIASGLRHHYDKETFEGRLVLVAANLKARKLAGFLSQGMVLCASADEKVVFVDPPANSNPGDRVHLSGLENPPASDKHQDKAKLFIKAQPHFNLKNGVVHFKDKPFKVADSSCTAPIDKSQEAHASVS